MIWTLIPSEGHNLALKVLFDIHLYILTDLFALVVTLEIANIELFRISILYDGITCFYVYYR